MSFLKLRYFKAVQHLRCFCQGSLSLLYQHCRAQPSAWLAVPALLILPGVFQHHFIAVVFLSSERVGMAVLWVAQQKG